MRRLIALISALLLAAPFSYADGITAGPVKAWESTVDTQSGHFFDLDSTYLGFCYVEFSAFDQSDGALLRLRKFNKSTKTWGTTVTEIYSNSSANPNTVSCRVIGTKVHILLTRRSAGGGFLDVVHFNSTDLTMTSWTAPETLYTFSGRKGNVHGDMIYIADRNMYLVPFYSHDGSQAHWRVGYFTSTDDGVTWTFSGTAIYGELKGNTKWGEVAIANAGGCNLVALIRNQAGNTKTGQATSIDCGDKWTNPDTDYTNMGVGTSITIPAVYYDESLDRLFAVIQDRALSSSGGNNSKLWIASPTAVFSDPDNWGSPVLTIDNFFAAGYATIANVDADEWIIAWFREDIEPNTISSRNLNNLDVRYIIYQIGSAPPDACPPTCPPTDVETNADYGGIEIRGLQIS